MRNGCYEEAHLRNRQLKAKRSNKPLVMTMYLDWLRSHGYNVGNLKVQ